PTDLLCFLMIPPPPRSTLFPYTTLFRSSGHHRHLALAVSAWAAASYKHRYFNAIACKLNLAAIRDRAAAPSCEMSLEHLARKSRDRKSTRLNSSHVKISYAVFCLKKKKK